MVDFWQYEDRSTTTRRRAQGLLGESPSPRIQAALPPVDRPDEGGQSSLVLPAWAQEYMPSEPAPRSPLSAAWNGLLDFVNIPADYIGKPLLGAISAGIMPGEQVHLRPGQSVFQQLPSIYNQWRQTEEERAPLFEFNVGPITFSEKWFSENLLADPLFWLGIGAASKTSKGLKLLEGLNLGDDALRAAARGSFDDVLRIAAEVGKVDDAARIVKSLRIARWMDMLDMATSPMAWPGALGRNVTQTALAAAGRESLEEIPNWLRWGVDLLEKHPGARTATEIAGRAGQLAGWGWTLPMKAMMAPYTFGMSLLQKQGLGRAISNTLGLAELAQGLGLDRLGEGLMRRFLQSEEGIWRPFGEDDATTEDAPPLVLHMVKPDKFLHWQETPQMPRSPSIDHQIKTTLWGRTAYSDGHILWFDESPWPDVEIREYPEGGNTVKSWFDDAPYTPERAYPVDVYPSDPGGTIFNVVLSTGGGLLTFVDQAKFVPIVSRLRNPVFISRGSKTPIEVRDGDEVKAILMPRQFRDYAEHRRFEAETKIKLVDDNTEQMFVKAVNRVPVNKLRTAPPDWVQEEKAKANPAKRAAARERLESLMMSMREAQLSGRDFQEWLDFLRQTGYWTYDRERGFYSADKFRDWFNLDAKPLDADLAMAGIPDLGDLWEMSKVGPAQRPTGEAEMAGNIPESSQQYPENIPNIPESAESTREWGDTVPVLRSGESLDIEPEAASAQRDLEQRQADPNAKEPWEIPLHIYRVDYPTSTGGVPIGRVNQAKARQHRESVRQALAEGKPVPPEVLQDYPDLAQQQPANMSKIADEPESAETPAQPISERMNVVRDYMRKAIYRQQTFEEWAATWPVDNPQFREDLRAAGYTSPREIWDEVVAKTAPLAVPDDLMPAIPDVGPDGKRRKPGEMVIEGDIVTTRRDQGWPVEYTVQVEGIIRRANGSISEITGRILLANGVRNNQVGSLLRLDVDRVAEVERRKPQRPTETPKAAESSRAFTNIPEQWVEIKPGINANGGQQRPSDVVQEGDRVTTTRVGMAPLRAQVYKIEYFDNAPDVPVRFHATILIEDGTLSGDDITLLPKHIVKVERLQAAQSAESSPNIPGQSPEIAEPSGEQAQTDANWRLDGIRELMSDFAAQGGTDPGEFYRYLDTAAEPLNHPYLSTRGGPSAHFDPDWLFRDLEAAGYGRDMSGLERLWAEVTGGAQPAQVPTQPIDTTEAQAGTGRADAEARLEYAKQLMAQYMRRPDAFPIAFYGALETEYKNQHPYMTGPHVDIGRLLEDTRKAGYKDLLDLWADVLIKQGIPLSERMLKESPDLQQYVDARSGKTGAQPTTQTTTEQQQPGRFYEGDRVVTNEGRHGTIARVVATSWQTPYGQTRETTYTYTVKTDNGAEVFSSQKELQAETERPTEPPVADPQLEGRYLEARSLWSELQVLQQRLRNAKGSLDRAKVEHSKAKWREEIARYTQDVRKYQQAWEEWATKNSELAIEASGSKWAPEGERPVQAQQATMPKGAKLPPYRITERSFRGGIEVRFDDRMPEELYGQIRSKFRQWGLQYSTRQKLFWVQPDSEDRRAEIVREVRAYLEGLSGAVPPVATERPAEQPVAATPTTRTERESVSTANRLYSAQNTEIGVRVEVRGDTVKILPIITSPAWHTKKMPSSAEFALAEWPKSLPAQLSLLTKQGYGEYSTGDMVRKLVETAIEKQRKDQPVQPVAGTRTEPERAERPAAEATPPHLTPEYRDAMRQRQEMAREWVRRRYGVTPDWNTEEGERQINEAYKDLISRDWHMPTAEELQAAFSEKPTVQPEDLADDDPRVVSATNAVNSLGYAYGDRQPDEVRRGLQVARILIDLLPDGEQKGVLSSVYDILERDFERSTAGGATEDIWAGQRNTHIVTFEDGKQERVYVGSRKPDGSLLLEKADDPGYRRTVWPSQIALEPITYDWPTEAQRQPGATRNFDYSEVAQEIANLTADGRAWGQPNRVAEIVVTIKREVRRTNALSPEKVDFAVELVRSQIQGKRVTPEETETALLVALANADTRDVDDRVPLVWRILEQTSEQRDFWSNTDAQDALTLDIMDYLGRKGILPFQAQEPAAELIMDTLRKSGISQPSEEVIRRAVDQALADHGAELPKTGDASHAKPATDRRRDVRAGDAVREQDIADTERVGDQDREALEGTLSETIQRVQDPRSPSGSRTPSGGSYPRVRGESGEATGVQPDAGGTRSGVGSGVQGTGQPVSEPETPPPASQPAPHAHAVLRDYRITDDDAVGAGGPKTKFRNNMEALRLLKQLRQEGRLATPEEQQVLARWTGMGNSAFNKAFGQGEYEPDVYHKRDAERNHWGAEYDEIRSLVTREEWEAIRRSRLNAHYTSPVVVRSMWDAVRRMGIDQAANLRVLEPGAGVGYFYGLMPEDLAGRSNKTAVEMDDISGEILKQLYQNADVRIQDFAKAVLPQNGFDLVITNVPFHDKARLIVPEWSKDGDRRWLLDQSLHNAYFARSVELLRPGGIMAAITTHYTMDAPSSQRLRGYLAKQADLLGAIRLPKTAFEQVAGTEVVTDILFLRKRFPGEEPNGIAWAATRAYKDRERRASAPVNEYFHAHPEMVVGKHAFTGSMYSQNEYTVEPREGDFGEQLRAALANLPKDVFKDVTTGSPFDGAMVDGEGWGLESSDRPTLPGSFVTQEDNSIGRFVGDKIEPVTFSKPEEEDKVRRVLGMRQIMREMNRGVFEGESLTKWALRRDKLREQFRQFIRTYGPLTDKKLARLMARDANADVVRALQRDDDDLIAQAEQIALHGTKGSCDWSLLSDEFLTRLETAYFESPAVKAKHKIEHVDTAKDALLVSLNEKGRIDLGRMRELTGKQDKDLISELQELVYTDPSGKLHLAEEYLSGNVKDKLRQAEEAARMNPAFQRNVEALRAVIPPDIPPEQITIKLGAPWVPKEVVRGFIGHLVNARPYDMEQIGAEYNSTTGMWYLRPMPNHLRHSDAYRRWSTREVGLDTFLDKIINGGEIIVYDPPDPVTKKRKKNIKATADALQMMNKIQQEFNRWAWSDSERTRQLAQIYNERYNDYVPRLYDGSHLTFPGMNPQIKFMDHQKNAVWRYLQSGVLLLAHEVGAGKTFESIAIAMEAKRLGMARKPVIIVPKNVIGQWQKAFRELYPESNVLVPQEGDMSPSNRREFITRIMTGDWDAVILTHPNMVKIPVREETQMQYAEERIRELEEIIAEAEAEKRAGTQTQEQAASQKEIEDRLAAEQARVEKLQQAINNRKDDAVYWEDLGADMLIVDEADIYKNLGFTTRMGSMKGIDPSYHQGTTDLHMKTQLLLRQNNGAGLVFGTGTPVANSVAEVWTMMRYLVPSMLRKYEIDKFDRWSRMFANPESKPEQKATGDFAMTTRISSFDNLAELSKLWQSMADIVFSEDVSQLEKRKPKLRSGGRISVECDSSQWQRDFTLSTKYRAANFDPATKDEDNHLKLMQEARMASVDPRLLDPFQKLPENGKIATLVKNVARIYKEEAAVQGTQLVFCDFGTPKTERELEQLIPQWIQRGQRVQVEIEAGKRWKQRQDILAERDKAERAAKKAGIPFDPTPYDRELEKLRLLGKDEVEFDDEPGDDDGLDVEEVNVAVSALDRQALKLQKALYEEIKSRLVEAGLKPEEIAYIHEASTDEAKEALFERVRKGEVRVLMGSTGKMGAGTNVQDRLAALHHLDTPWRPRDIEQREGRILRQGNWIYGPKLDANGEVEDQGIGVDIYQYVTKGSLDGLMWRAIERKWLAIKSIMKRNVTARSLKGLDGDVIDAATFAAIALDNPLMMEKLTRDTQLAELSMEYQSWLDQERRMREMQATLPGRIEDATKWLGWANGLADALPRLPEKPTVTIGDKIAEGYAKVDALLKHWFDQNYKAIRKAVTQKNAGFTPVRSSTTLIGQFGPYDLYAELNVLGYDKDQWEDLYFVLWPQGEKMPEGGFPSFCFTTNVRVSDITDGGGWTRRVIHVIEGFAKKQEELTHEFERLQGELERANNAKATGFPKSKERHRLEVEIERLQEAIESNSTEMPDFSDLDRLDAEALERQKYLDELQREEEKAREAEEASAEGEAAEPDEVQAEAEAPIEMEDIENGVRNAEYDLEVLRDGESLIVIHGEDHKRFHYSGWPKGEQDQWIFIMQRFGIDPAAPEARVLRQMLDDQVKMVDYEAARAKREQHEIKAAGAQNTTYGVSAIVRDGAVVVTKGKSTWTFAVDEWPTDFLDQEAFFTRLVGPDNLPTGERERAATYRVIDKAIDKSRPAEAPAPVDGLRMEKSEQPEAVAPAEESPQQVVVEEDRVGQLEDTDTGARNTLHDVSARLVDGDTIEFCRKGKYYVIPLDEWPQDANAQRALLEKLLEQQPDVYEGLALRGVIEKAIANWNEGNVTELPSILAQPDEVRLEEPEYHAQHTGQDSRVTVRGDALHFEVKGKTFEISVAEWTTDHNQQGELLRQFVPDLKTLEGMVVQELARKALDKQREANPPMPVEETQPEELRSEEPLPTEPRMQPEPEIETQSELEPEPQAVEIPEGAEDGPWRKWPQVQQIKDAFRTGNPWKPTYKGIYDKDKWKLLDTGVTIAHRKSGGYNVEFGQYHSIGEAKTLGQAKSLVMNEFIRAWAGLADERSIEYYRQFARQKDLPEPMTWTQMMAAGAIAKKVKAPQPIEAPQLEPQPERDPNKIYPEDYPTPAWVANEPDIRPPKAWKWDESWLNVDTENPANRATWEAAISKLEQWATLGRDDAYRHLTSADRLFAFHRADVYRDALNRHTAAPIQPVIYDREALLLDDPRWSDRTKPLTSHDFEVAYRRGLRHREAGDAYELPGGLKVANRYGLTDKTQIERAVGHPISFDDLDLWVDAWGLGNEGKPMNRFWEKPGQPEAQPEATRPEEPAPVQSQPGTQPAEPAPAQPRERVPRAEDMPGVPIYESTSAGEGYRHVAQVQGDIIRVGSIDREGTYVLPISFRMSDWPDSHDARIRLLQGQGTVKQTIETARGWISLVDKALAKQQAAGAEAQPAGVRSEATQPEVPAFTPRPMPSTFSDEDAANRIAQENGTDFDGAIVLMQQALERAGWKWYKPEGYHGGWQDPTGEQWPMWRAQNWQQAVIQGYRFALSRGAFDNLPQQEPPPVTRPEVQPESQQDVRQGEMAPTEPATGEPVPAFVPTHLLRTTVMAEPIEVMIVREGPEGMVYRTADGIEGISRKNIVELREIHPVAEQQPQTVSQSQVEEPAPVQPQPEAESLGETIANDEPGTMNDQELIQAYINSLWQSERDEANRAHEDDDAYWDAVRAGEVIDPVWEEIVQRVMRAPDMEAKASELAALLGDNGWITPEQFTSRLWDDIQGQEYDESLGGTPEPAVEPAAETMPQLPIERQPEPAPMAAEARPDLDTQLTRLEKAMQANGVISSEEVKLILDALLDLPESDPRFDEYMQRYKAIQEYQASARPVAQPAQPQPVQQPVVETQPDIRPEPEPAPVEEMTPTEPAPEPGLATEPGSAPQPEPAREGKARNSSLNAEAQVREGMISLMRLGHPAVDIPADQWPGNRDAQLKLLQRQLGDEDSHARAYQALINKALRKAGLGATPLSYSMMEADTDGKLWVQFSRQPEKSIRDKMHTMGFKWDKTASRWEKIPRTDADRQALVQSVQRILGKYSQTEPAPEAQIPSPAGTGTQLPTGQRPTEEQPEPGGQPPIGGQPPAGGPPPDGRPPEGVNIGNPYTPGNDLAKGRAALMRPQSTLRQKLEQALDKVIRAVYDRVYPLKELEKATGIKAYTLARLVPGATMAGESILEREVRPIFANLDKEDLDNVQLLMTLERGLDLRAKRPDAKLPGGVEDPQRAIDELREELGSDNWQVIREAADKLYDVNRRLILDILTNAGLMSRETRDTLMQDWPHYIPFFRQGYDFEDLPFTGAKSEANVSERIFREINEAGSELALNEPLAQLQAQVVRAQMLAARNNAAKALVDALEEYGNITGEEMIKRNAKGRGPYKGTVSYYQDGKKITCQVPLVYERVAKGMDHESANALMGILRRMAYPLRMGAVSGNPSFLLPNVIRDIISAWFREGVNPLSDLYINAWRSAILHDDTWHEVARAGGFASGVAEVARRTDELANVKRMGRIEVKNIGDALMVPWRLIAKYNEIGEQATRIAVWEKLKAEGVDELERALRTRDVTVDFAKSGNLVRLLSQAIPFLNAGVQGTANTLRMMRDNPAAALSRAALLGLFTILFRLYGRRFEDTNDEIPDYEYEDSWVIQIAEGTRNADPRYPTAEPEKFPIYIRIPKGPLASLLMAPVEACLNIAMQKNDLSVIDHIGWGLRTGLGAISPLEPSASELIPPLIGTVTQMESNYDYFRSQPIIPQSELSRPPEAQYGRDTSRTGIAVGQAIGQSPRMVDFLIENSLGGSGTTGLWIADILLGALGYNPEVPGGGRYAERTTAEKASQLPVVGRFLGTRGNASERAAYQALDRTMGDTRRIFYENPEVKRLGMGFNAPGQTVTVNGVPYQVSVEQRNWIVEQTTPLVEAAWDSLIQTRMYQRMGDAERRQMLETARDKIMENARQQITAQWGQGTADGEPAPRLWREQDMPLLVQAIQEYQEYKAIPSYKGLSEEETWQTQEALGKINAMRRANPRITRGMALALYARQDPEGARLARLASRRSNPVKARFWRAHPLLSVFFGDLELEELETVVPQYEAMREPEKQTLPTWAEVYVRG